MPVKNIEVQDVQTKKTVTWEYPYKRLTKRYGFFLSCREQDQRDQQQIITNGFQVKELFDCRRGLWGQFIGEFDNGDPSKVLTNSLIPNSVGENNYQRVCHAVLHEWPFLPERPASAEVDLGISYEFGWDGGKDRDYAEAVKWFRKAADQGNAEGQHDLGSMFELGEGVQRDYTEAAKWYRLAAEQDNGDAQLSLGIMYYSGNGVTRDYVQAYKWFTLALARFPENSPSTMAIMHGDVNDKSMKCNNCIEWLKKVTTVMTPTQIVEAQRQASGWQPTHSEK